MTPSVVVVALLCSAAACAPARDGNDNGNGDDEADGVDDPFDFPDPFVLATGDGSFVGFATNGADANVPLARSDDLVRWSRGGDALPELPAWALADAFLTWAPAVLPRDDGFVLYYTARHIDSDFQCIGRATAAAVEGPYVDTFAGPLVCQVEEPAALCGSIDPSPFVDDDGAAWLLWKSDENAAACQQDSRLWSQRLTDDGLALTGAPTALLARDQDWEFPLIEGPALHRNVNGDLVLFYSANRWETGDYASGWASCASPQGPCLKQSVDAPWVSSDRGPGGGDLVGGLAVGGGRAAYFAHHAWTEPGGAGVRELVVEALSYDDDGVPVLTPVVDPVAAP